MENIDGDNDALESHWVVVADAHEARMFHGVDPRADLREFTTLTNEDARKQGDEIDTDGPGRRSDGGGHRSAMPANPVEHRKREFAARVANWLEDHRTKEAFQRLTIIAAPSFLGDLRNNMSRPLQDKVVEEIDKNLTGHKVDEIREALQRTSD
jgi:protein required for attachment to host cells